MRNVCLHITAFLLFLLGFKSNAQGKDVIVLLDNVTMNDSDYNVMKSHAQQIINSILSCDSNNRVAVVQYGGYFANDNYSYPKANLYIESDFTNDASVATNFIRRTDYWVGGTANFTHETLPILDNALDGIVSPDAKGPQKTLNQSPSNSLVVFLYTFGQPADFNNRLISAYATSSNIYSNTAYTYYTYFKEDRGATFVVMSRNINARYVAGAIASSGGPNDYDSIVIYPDDPDKVIPFPGEQGEYGGVDPYGRYLFSTADYPSTIASSICSLDCEKKITLKSPNHDLSTGASQQKNAGLIFAGNIINNSATAEYKAGQEVVLTQGFHAKSGSNVKVYINPSCGTSGRPSGTEQEFTFQEEELSKNGFVMYPNPSSSITTIKLDNDVIASVTVTSIEGMLMYSGKVGKETFDLNVSTYRQGIYIVTVETQKGEVLTEKLMKN